MAGLGDLIIKLSADTAEFQSDMGRTAHQVERDMERMAARATAAGQLIGDAIGGAARSFARLAAEAVKTGDELNKLSQKSGMSVERLSELKFAGDLADVSMGQLTGSLGFFNKALAEAQNESSKSAQLFKAMGVDINAGPQKAFDQFMRAINTLPDGETKVAAMRIAFGRAGDALIPLAAGMDDAAEKARRLGLIWSQQMAKDSEAFNDSMKALSASTQGLIVQGLGPTIAGLATLSSNLLDAKMKGEMLTGAVRELGKVSASLLSTNPLFKMMLGGRIDAAFKPPSQGGASGSWDDGTMGPPGSAANPEAVACVVSGGKWENGQCVRKSPGGSGGGSKQMSFEELLARNSLKREEMLDRVEQDATRRYQTELEQQERLKEVEERRMKSLAESYKNIADPMKRYTDQLIEIRDLLAKGFLTEEQAAAAEWRIQNAIEDMNRAKDAAKQTNDIARELGLTFNSAFEDAVTGAKSFGEALRGLAMDLAKLALRKSITEPLMGAVSGALGKVDFGSWFGGGASTPATPAAPSVNTNVAVADIQPMAGRAPVVVNQTVQFSANTPEAVRAAVQAAAPGLIEASKASMLEAQLRGNRA